MLNLIILVLKRQIFCQKDETMSVSLLVTRLLYVTLYIGHWSSVCHGDQVLARDSSKMLTKIYNFDIMLRGSKSTINISKDIQYNKCLVMIFEYRWWSNNNIKNNFVCSSNKMKSIGLKLCFLIFYIFLFYLISQIIFSGAWVITRICTYYRCQWLSFYLMIQR